jgi:hypothetical protein
VSRAVRDPTPRVRRRAGDPDAESHPCSRCRPAGRNGLAPPQGYPSSRASILWTVHAGEVQSAAWMAVAVRIGRAGGPAHLSHRGANEITKYSQ